MEHDFLGLPNGKFPGATEHLRKGRPVFPDGITEIRVPFLQSHLSYQLQAFVAAFRYMELICTNGRRDSGTKFTSPELCDEPFSTQTVNRPVCPPKCKTSSDVSAVVAAPRELNMQNFNLAWIKRPVARVMIPSHGENKQIAQDLLKVACYICHAYNHLCATVCSCVQ